MILGSLYMSEDRLLTLDVYTYVTIAKRMNIAILFVGRHSITNISPVLIGFQFLSLKLIVDRLLY